MFLTPVIFIAAGVVTLFCIGSDPSGPIGYRSSRARKSQASWDYAQRFSGILSILLGVLSLLLSYVLGQMELSLTITSFLSIGNTIVVAAVLIGLTEYKLKSKFA